MPSHAVGLYERAPFFLPVSGPSPGIRHLRAERGVVAHSFHANHLVAQIRRFRMRRRGLIFDQFHGNSAAR
jgi:hypothetical protein